MNIIKSNNLTCPIDGERLAINEKSMVCQQGHVFDVARQGYINLLPVQHKRSKDPGDSKEMVLARTHFLNSGVYQAIASKLAEITRSQLPDHEDICIMDAGCGEGYYLDVVFNHLRDVPGSSNLSFIGLDISKPAIMQAAKRNKQISWIVGTNRQPPVVAASVDIILCVFGFQSFEGFKSVLKTGGKVILIEPGPDHLVELRKIIYTEVKKTEPADLSYLDAKGFSLSASQSLQFTTGVINNEQINNLLLMTPHFYRATQQGREAAASLEGLDLTVDVVFRSLQKD